MTPEFSILILSTRRRSHFLSRLLDRITPQLCPETEMLISVDDATIPVWQKRNQLLHASRGNYVAFVDDDDLVSPDYVASILLAAKEKTDCITFKVARFLDGQLTGEARHSLDYSYYSHQVKAGWTTYQRPPNHLNPVRSALAKQIAFEDHGMEDVDFSSRLRPHLRTEVFIDRILYEYYFVTPAERFWI